MAIEIKELKTPISVNEAIDFLQRQTDEFGLFLDLDRLAEYELYFRYNMKNAERKMYDTVKDYSFEPTDNGVINMLKKWGIAEYKIAKKVGRNLKVSIDKSVRENLMADESIDKEIREFIKAYHEYSNFKYNVSYIRQYVSLPNCNVLSYNNHRMVVGHPTWNRLNTNRISANSPSLQNIPRYMKDIVTSPKGWKLYRVDSGQIEPRITYSWFIPDKLIANLIISYNDAYAGMMHYSEMTDEEIETLSADFSKFVPLQLGEEFDSKRQSYKKLALSANYGSKNLDVPPKIAMNYERRIINHPLRLSKEREVKNLVARGVETFYTAFGNAITPDSTTKHKKGDESWVGHVERCGINNPIQGTASDLMLFSINEARKVIAEYPDTHIAFYKHDEGAFYVKEEQFDEVVEKLKEITAYHVEGWIPINCNGEVGQLKTEEVPSILW